MSDQTIVSLAALVALAGLMAYAVFGGADFGGGVWSLFATGPRKELQRRAVAEAMGPVWEVNHVWLIFVIVVLFTCFPRGFGALVTGLFVPLHLVLVGIILRGAAFVFRGYGPSPAASENARASGHYARWGTIFGIASVISPLLLGAAFGALTAGEIRVDPAGRVRSASPVPWLHVYPISCGLLALSTCAYLAAVFLVVETTGQLQEDFRRRAIFAGTATASLALFTLVAARMEAKWFFDQLTAPMVWPVIAAGMIAFAGSAVAVFARWNYAARWFAGAQTVLMLLGWGMAHRQYLIYPDIPLAAAAGPRETIVFLLISLVPGATLLIPALWLLFRTFKSPSARTMHS
ncbi:MAG: cytochrome d ubiquinol oxidase subunit II [Phycisphaerae bacterium]|nr:cytochrome d ubiquinol oxidase subunit II [Phycisphaerae bacterium]MDW8261083.1 cytochrome d ubiquinol oxidase subunit II [Phycisphaerales bacterium]